MTYTSFSFSLFLSPSCVHLWDFPKLCCICFLSFITCAGRCWLCCPEIMTHGHLPCAHPLQETAPALLWPYLVHGVRSVAANRMCSYRDHALSRQNSDARNPGDDRHPSGACTDLFTTVCALSLSRFQEQLSAGPGAEGVEGTWISELRCLHVCAHIYCWEEGAQGKKQRGRWSQELAPLSPSPYPKSMPWFLRLPRILNSKPGLLD